MKLHTLIVTLLVMSLAACSAKQPAPVRLVMHTTVGDIELELYPDRAPVTAGNFLRLVNGGILDGASFYRVVSPDNDNGSPVITVIQGGVGDAIAPFPPIPHESTLQTGLPHLDGSISMARGDIGTASTEFFICIGAQSALDYGGARNTDGQGFAVFGRVVSGMDVVQKIHGMPANAATEFDYFRGQLLDEPVVIETVRRVSL